MSELTSHAVPPDSVGAVPAAPPADVVPAGEERSNPFPGLRPFEEKNAPLFFGRAEQVTDLLNHLKRHRFLAVVGVSGSGKSSLVKAGLIPRLRQGFLASAGERWRVVLSRPGKAPIDALAKALEKTLGETCQASKLLLQGSRGLMQVADESLDVDENLLIVVDQFEEVFRFKHLAECGSPDEKISAVAQSSDFVYLLLTALADDRINIVITMRSDYLGDCAQFQELPEHINEGQYLIPRLSIEQQREVIVRPIWARQAKISELLVQRLLDEVGPEPENLPILQHVLSRLWYDWEKSGSGEPIGLPNLESERVGSFKNAMNVHAEGVYKNLPSDLHRWVTKRLFQRITLRGTSEHPIRRADTLGDIRAIIDDAGPTADQALSEVLSQALLLVLSRFRDAEVGFITSPEPEKLSSDPVIDISDESPNSVIDISHESLCWLWKRLKTWVDEEAESAELYSRVSKLAQLHATDKKQQGVYTDPGLTYVLNEYRPGKPSERDPNKVDPWNEPWSTIYNKQWKATLGYLEESRVRRNVWRGAKVLLAGCMIVLVGVIASASAYFLDKKADDLASQADYEHNLLGGSSQERAALLDVTSFDTKEKLSNGNIAFWEEYRRLTSGTPVNLHNDSLNKDTPPLKQLSVLADQQPPDAGANRVPFRIVATFSPKDLQPSPLPPPPIVFRSDTLATDSEFTQFTGTKQPVTAISPLGQYAATQCNNGAGTIWDIPNKKPLFSIDNCANGVASIVETANSQLLVIIEINLPVNSTFRIYNRSGHLIYKQTDIPLRSTAFSPDGRYFAFVTKPQDSAAVLNLVDLATPNPISVPIENSIPERAPTLFSPRGRFVAVGMADGSILLYDIPARVTARLGVAPRSSAITALAFSHNSELFAYGEASSANLVRVVQFPKPIDEMPIDETEKTHEKVVKAQPLWSDFFGRSAVYLSFSPKDKFLGLALGEKTARVKIAKTGFETARVTHQGLVSWIEFSPNEDKAFSGSDDGQVLSFGTETAHPNDQGDLTCHAALQVIFSDDGKAVAASCAEPDNDHNEVKPSAVVFHLKDDFVHDRKLTGIGDGRPWSFSELGRPCLVTVSGNGAVAVAECQAAKEQHESRGPLQRDSNDPRFSFLSVLDLNALQRPLDLSLDVPKDLAPSNSERSNEACRNQPTSIALNYQGSILAVGDGCGRVFIFSLDRKSGRASRKDLLFEASNTTVLKALNISDFHGGQSILALAFSGRSTMLAIGTAYGAIWIQDLNDKTRILMPKTFTGSINAMRFAPAVEGEGDSSRMIIASGGTAHVTRIEDGKDLFNIADPTARITALAFSASGLSAAAGTSNGNVYIFDLSSSRVERLKLSLEAWSIATFFRYKMASVPGPAKGFRRSQQSEQPEQRMVYGLYFPDDKTLIVAANHDSPFAQADNMDVAVSGVLTKLPLSLTKHNLDIYDYVMDVCKEDLVPSPELSYQTVCRKHRPTNPVSSGPSTSPPLH